ncbi:MAG: DUF1641 domain-containing protein [Hydrogenibacillus schlegelii]|uniref:DUF1641 domain-containing protein n=1 Tax=Hydrogenibacillus schlegelii TaxID=1484 RepID=A0A947D3W1_HYDSH|nr:DUF1641 domain-containing protein [Hydrogenibacillus schlegelii]
MAKAISFIRPSEEERAKKTVQPDAALEEAMALLAALHEAGFLSLLKGAVLSRNEVLEIIVQAINSDEGKRFLKNIIQLLMLFGSKELEKAIGVSRAVLTNMEEAAASLEDPPPKWRHLLAAVNDPDVRRGLAFLLAVAKALGRAFRSPQS